MAVIVARLNAPQPVRLSLRANLAGNAKRVHVVSAVRRRSRIENSLRSVSLAACIAFAISSTTAATVFLRRGTRPFVLKSGDSTPSVCARRLRITGIRSS